MKKKTPELSEVRVVTTTKVKTTETEVVKVNQKQMAEGSLDAVNVAAKSMQSDAPACNVCGAITIRSGTCYKCINCGNSLGCS